MVLLLFLHLLVSGRGTWLHWKEHWLRLCEREHADYGLFPKGDWFQRCKFGLAWSLDGDLKWCGVHSKRTNSGEGSHLHRVETLWLLYKISIPLPLKWVSSTCSLICQHIVSPETESPYDWNNVFPHLRWLSDIDYLMEQSLLHWNRTSMSTYKFSPIKISSLFLVAFLCNFKYYLICSFSKINDLYV